jgi:Flp pilus assembly protein TadB
MELIIASLVALLAFLLFCQLVYRHRLAASKAARALSDMYRVEDHRSEEDPESPEYKLAQAGVRTSNPALTWALLRWGPPVAAFIIAIGVGFPFIVAIAAGAIGLVAPRKWIEGRIKDRGRRTDDEVPKGYVRLLSVLRASRDAALALDEVAATLELERNGPTLLSTEFRTTAAEMLDSNIGREEGLRRLERRAASVSLANLALLLERFTQAGGDRFYSTFETAAQNVQGILDARQKARARAAEQMQITKFVPALLAALLLYFMNDPGFALAFREPRIQIALAVTAVIMFAGYLVMTDMAKEAV